MKSPRSSILDSCWFTDLPSIRAPTCTHSLILMLQTYCPQNVPGACWAVLAFVPCDLVFFPTMHVLLSTHVSLKTQFSHPSPLRNVLFHSLSCNCAFLYPAQNLSQLYLECMYLCHFNETVISVKPKRKSQGNMDSRISLECKLFQDSWVFF